MLNLATTLHDQQAGLAMGNWACSSYKKEKAENQGAGQKLKIVRKEEKVFLQKTTTLIKIVSLNN